MFPLRVYFRSPERGCPLTIMSILKFICAYFNQIPSHNQTLNVTNSYTVLSYKKEIKQLLNRCSDWNVTIFSGFQDGRKLTTFPG